MVRSMKVEEPKQTSIIVIPFRCHSELKNLVYQLDRKTFLCGNRQRSTKISIEQQYLSQEYGATQQTPYLNTDRQYSGDNF